MRKLLLILFCLTALLSQAQFGTPRIEVYAAPGLFFERLSDDGLVPPDRRKGNRLGDVASYGAQFAFPLKNNRFTLKAGAAFSQRHYSLNKYNLNDFFTAIFSLGLAQPNDTFNLSYVRFANNYLQVPLSCSYTVTNLKKNFKLAFGLNLRNDFLVSQKVRITFDSVYVIPQPADIIAAKNLYTSNKSKFVFTAESFIEESFHVRNNVGMLFQFRPFSFYSSPLDKRLTTSTIEVFGFTFGAFYSLK